MENKTKRKSCICDPFQFIFKGILLKACPVLMYHRRFDFLQILWFSTRYHEWFSNIIRTVDLAWHMSELNLTGWIRLEWCCLSASLVPYLAIRLDCHLMKTTGKSEYERKDYVLDIDPVTLIQFELTHNQKY